MGRSVAERFWTKVDVREPDECWEWTGCRVNGYGELRVGGKGLRAHRVAYELTRGPIPDGLDACHHCDNPPCCNPNHLFIGDASANVLDAVAKGRWPSKAGELNGRAKLTLSDVRAIRRRVADGEPKRVLADAYGIHLSSIYRVAAGGWADADQVPA